MKILDRKKWLHMQHREDRKESGKMRYKSVPEYGARVREENIVIGHWESYAIVRKCDQSLCYLMDPDTLIATGTYVSEEGLYPINALPKDIYQIIIELCEVG